MGRMNSDVLHSAKACRAAPMPLFCSKRTDILGSLLQEYLQAKNYEADWVTNGEKAFRHFEQFHYDLCLLDVMMPIKDGFTLASEIRIMNNSIPIIFLTAKSMKEDVLEGFSLGADDYITKPFSMEELLFRIEAILRRTKGTRGFDKESWEIGSFTFDVNKQMLKGDGTEQKLTTKESELLKLLCNNMNQVLGKRRGAWQAGCKNDICFYSSK